MENIRGLTPDQERFFSLEDSSKQLTPFSVFYSVLAAIMVAWLLISLITYIAVSIFLNSYRAEMLSQIDELRQNSRLLLDNPTVNRQISRSPSAPPDKHKGPRIIHIDRE
ncbi:hypothetical protein [Methylophilus methylotrophus]|uniref:hypothetical protein n=1 Tax=Methylophilus methylotrophus TaxID=17 RepID=UPI0003680EB7|nr:hypothetical protein [Methylophilus methylotrophus]